MGSPQNRECAALPALDSTDCRGLPCNSADPKSPVYCDGCVRRLLAQTYSLLDSVAWAFSRTVRNGQVPPDRSDPDGGLEKMRDAYNALHDHPVARAAYAAVGKRVSTWP